MSNQVFTKLQTISRKEVLKKPSQKIETKQSLSCISDKINIVDNTYTIKKYPNLIYINELVIIRSDNVYQFTYQNIVIVYKDHSCEERQESRK